MNRTRNFLTGLLLVSLSAYFCFGGLLVIGEYNGLTSRVINLSIPPLFWIYSYVIAALFASFGFNFIDKALDDPNIVKISSIHFLIGIVFVLCAAVFNGGLCLLTDFCIYSGTVGF